MQLINTWYARQFSWIIDSTITWLILTRAVGQVETGRCIASTMRLQVCHGTFPQMREGARTDLNCCATFLSRWYFSRIEKAHIVLSVLLLYLCDVFLWCPSYRSFWFKWLLDFGMGLLSILKAPLIILTMRKRGNLAWFNVGDKPRDLLWHLLNLPTCWMHGGSG